MTTLHTARLKDHPTYESVPGYWERHVAAIDSPRGLELPFVGMLRAWLAYADIHLAKHGSAIGDDGFLGPEWEQIGKALRAMLNGDLGRRLDMGALDSVIMDALVAEGYGDA